MILIKKRSDTMASVRWSRRPKSFGHARRKERPETGRRFNRWRPILEQLENRLAPAGFGGGDPLYTVTNLNDFGPGSLREAILNNNNSTGGNTITFAIDTPGSSHTIQ